MPQCVECGCEAPREEMFGMADDLRCATCAGRRRKTYAPLPQPVLKIDVVTTSVIVGIAIFVYVFDQWGFEQVVRDPAADPIVPFRYLAADPHQIWLGQIWRLATSALVHSPGWGMGLMHLAFNCFWIWRFAPPVEAWAGRLGFLGIFLLLSAPPIAAEIIAFVAMPVGLSGVNYGLFGLLYALKRSKDFAAHLITPAVTQIMVGWFFFCIFLTATGAMGVANVAHGVGALMGWLIGRASLQKQRVTAMLGVVLLGIALCLGAIYMPWDARYCAIRAVHAANEQDLPSLMEWNERAEHAIRPISP